MSSRERVPQPWTPPGRLGVIGANLWMEVSVC
jgi:hypothetical protein